jgi:hypothetical protein
VNNLSIASIVYLKKSITFAYDINMKMKFVDLDEL